MDDLKKLLGQGAQNAQDFHNGMNLAGDPVRATIKDTLGGALQNYHDYQTGVKQNQFERWNKTNTMLGQPPISRKKFDEISQIMDMTVGASMGTGSGMNSFYSARFPQSAVPGGEVASQPGIYSNAGARTDAVVSKTNPMQFANYSAGGNLESVPNPRFMNSADIQYQGNPDAKAYEQAINSGNVALAEKISKLHPGDAVFQVHRMLQSLLGGAK